MDRRWVGPDGYEIVPAYRRDRQVLRVRRHGTPIADCVSVEEVARFVDLADLCEVIPLPGRAADARTAAGRDHAGTSQA